MFTGLIAEVGIVGFVHRRPSGLEYEVSCPVVRELFEIGSSVAVNGVCQTVSRLTEKGFVTEAVESTLHKTTVAGFCRGERVNIEPALRAGDSLDGHLLQGHVQMRGRVLSVKNAGLAWILEIETSGAAPGIIIEGSIGIDGVSLTVSTVGQSSFTVHIIPQTWKNTTLNLKRAGDSVNIEGDILVRSLQQGAGKDLSESRLIEWGY
jgi:riboflavin synthase